MKPRLVWLAAAYLALAGTSLAAQERVLTGTVTDSATGDPIAGASIGIQGTRIATHTNASGVFNLAALPDSDLTVMIRFIGYRKRDILVLASQTTMTVQLVKDLFKLEEIVVTGQATGIERKNIATSVATVSADEMNITPSVSVESAAGGQGRRGRYPEQWGAPGGGLQMRLARYHLDQRVRFAALRRGRDRGERYRDSSNQNAVTKAAAGATRRPTRMRR